MSSTRIVMLAVATGLSVAACSSSNTTSPTTSPSTVVASPPTTSAPSQGDAQVRGLVASVAGNAVQVTQQTGTATVDFTGSAVDGKCPDGGGPHRR